MVRLPARSLIPRLALILMVASIAMAQAPATGQLTGTVTDPQNAVIPRAEIRAVNEQTGAEFTTVAYGYGRWIFSSLPGGSYSITVTAQGFRSSVPKDVKLDPGSTAKLDTTLQIGLAVPETIEVVSNFEEAIIDAPATASVISEPTILNSPSPNLGELLGSIPGVNIAQTTAREYNITSRAATGVFSGTQLALIDGRTIYHDDMGYLCWDGQATNLSELKQVEVIRGPGSAIWGANAMNGVINIITKQPREMLGSAFTLGIGTFDRSGGAADSDRGSLYYFNVSHAHALNDRWAYKITGGAFTQDAFARPQGSMPNSFHTPYPSFPNEGTTQPNVDGRADYDFRDGKRHLIFSGGYGDTNGILHTQIGPYKVHSEIKTYGKVDYLRGSLRITGYTNIDWGKSTNLLFLSPEGQPLQANNKDQTYHIEFSDFRTIHAKHLVSYGGNFRHNEFDLTTAPEGKRRDEGGAYLQDEVLLSEHFRWVAGARIDKFSFLEGVVVSPRTTFMIKIVPSHTLRVSYNRAYTAPTVLMNHIQNHLMMLFDLGLISPELAGNYFGYPLHVVGNAKLKEQSLNAYEIGYSAMIANGRVNLGAAFYINNSNNFLGFLTIGTYSSQNPPPGWPLPAFVLDLMGLPSLMTYGNLGKIRNKGLELNFDARFNRYLSGYANYSWQARPEPKGFDISLINVPAAHRFNAGADFNYKRYVGNISVGYVGSAQWNDVIGPPYSGPTNAYTFVNTGVGIRWGENRNYKVMVKVSNLGNTPIQSHVFGDIIKRQITGELRMRF